MINKESQRRKIEGSKKESKRQKEKEKVEYMQRKAEDGECMVDRGKAEKVFLSFFCFFVYNSCIR